MNKILNCASLCKLSECSEEEARMLWHQNIFFLFLWRHAVTSHVGKAQNFLMISDNADLLFWLSNKTFWQYEKIAWFSKPSRVVVLSAVFATTSEIGKYPSLNTQSCIRGHLCSTFRFEIWGLALKKPVFSTFSNFFNNNKKKNYKSHFM